MVRGVIRSIVHMLLLLAGLGAGIAWLGRNPPARGSATAPAATAVTPRQAPPNASASALATPFGDAVFRWRCTMGLKEAVGDRPGWPLQRLAALCLCAADRLREDGLRDIVLGAGDVAASLEAAEARLCRPS